MFNSSGFAPPGRNYWANGNKRVARNCLWMTNGRVCGKLCQNASELMDHLKIHTKGTRDYNCYWEACSLKIKNLATPSQFYRHVTRHTGVKPFKCHICGKRFADFDTVTVHRKIHGNTKDFPCSICGRNFAIASSLAKHMQALTENEQYFCGNCGKRFCSITARKAHQKICYGRPIFKNETTVPIYEKFELMEVTEKNDTAAEMPAVFQTSEELDFNSIWDLYIADITGTPSDNEVVDKPVELAAIDPYDLFIPHIDVYFKLVRF
ncbi:unnamed protein product [Caenorhabditis brenneri]